MFFTNILDFLFPFTCAGCELDDFLLCERCKSMLVPVNPNMCPTCTSTSQAGGFCTECAGHWHLDSLFVAYKYLKTGPLARLLHYYKYNELKAYETPLKILFAGRLSHTFSAGKSDALLTYVPMHSKKLKLRGFNPAETLARSIGTPVNLLVKVANRPAQMSLSRQERLANVQGMFAIKEGVESLLDRDVFIVDDVATTLSTLNECAIVLKAGGARKVFGLVLARQEA